jgi:hypothetical protein
LEAAFCDAAAAVDGGDADDEAAVAAGCAAGDLNVPVEDVDFEATGACGGSTSTDSVKVRFSAA